MPSTVIIPSRQIHSSGLDRLTYGAIGLNSAGACFGALFTAWYADRFSRKRAIQLGSLVLVIGAGLCGGSINVGMFMAARFIAGFGIGILFTVSPLPSHIIN